MVARAGAQLDVGVSGRVCHLGLGQGSLVRQCTQPAQQLSVHLQDNTLVIRLLLYKLQLFTDFHVS